MRLLHEDKPSDAIPAALQSLRCAELLYGQYSYYLVPPFLMLADACVGLSLLLVLLVNFATCSAFSAFFLFLSERFHIRYTPPNVTFFHSKLLLDNSASFKSSRMKDLCRKWNGVWKSLT